MTSTYAATYALLSSVVPTVLPTQSKNQGDVKFFDVPPIASGTSAIYCNRAVVCTPGLLIKQTNTSENMLMKVKPTFRKVGALCLSRIALLMYYNQNIMHSFILFSYPYEE